MGSLMGFDISFQRELASETWSLYGVGVFFIALRTYARVHRVGMSGLQADDYLMLLAGAFYTVLVVCLNVIAQGGGSNLFPLEQLSSFSPADIQERIKGSKIVIISEQAMLNVIYTIKSCMLIMYGRLTLALRQKKFIKYIAIYVACGWVATEMTFFLACRPFNGYWAVPPPNPQCTTLEHYAEVQAVFNISSDLMMLGVMLPLFASVAKLPLKQKISLLIVFGMGSFVIVAAILTKYFNLSNVYSTAYMLWYVREASTAMYVSNLPMIWPLLREWFPRLRRWAPGSRTPSKETRGASNYLVHDTKSGAGGKTWKRSGIRHSIVHLTHLGSSKHNDFEMLSGERDVERAQPTVIELSNRRIDGKIHAITTTTIDYSDESINSIEEEKTHGKHAGVTTTIESHDPYEWNDDDRILGRNQAITAPPSAFRPAADGWRGPRVKHRRSPSLMGRPSLSRGDSSADEQPHAL